MALARALCATRVVLPAIGTRSSESNWTNCDLSRAVARLNLIPAVL
jgi:hypothetical protein